MDSPAQQPDAVAGASGSEPAPAAQPYASYPLRRRDLTPDEIDKIDALNGYILLPWLLIALGPASDLWEGRLHHPAFAAAGLVLFAACYCAAILTGFHASFDRTGLPDVLAVSCAVLAIVLLVVYPDCSVLFSLAAIPCAGVLRRQWARAGVFGLPLLLAATDLARGRGLEWNAMFSTFLGGVVTFTIFELATVVQQLKATRQELARAAVAGERLRFSRDLHDLLGHSMSVVAVKAEAVRRLAPRDLDAALAQAADIETVSRRALVEIRQAVSGYRETSLAEELDRARSVLAAAGIEAVVRESGPPLPARTEALLAWVVREGVTNVVRHSRAGRCEIDLCRGAEPVRLSIRDDGRPAAGGAGPGNGLRGLIERLTAAGGALTPEPGPDGFLLTATLPAERDRTAAVG